MAEFHAWIPVSTQVHELPGARGIMIVGALFAVIRAIYAGTIVDVLDYAAPFGARGTGYENILQWDPLGIV